MIHTEDADGYRIVTLDRPEQRNALTPAGLDALEDAVTDCPEPVVYLRGADEAFCAGADFSVVADVANAADADEDAVEPFVRRGQRVADAIETSSSVVVAGIDGPARGGGVELAAACDMRIATPDATFGEPGVTFGLFGAWGGTVRLPEILGLGDALDFSLSGRVIDAAEALRIGLVSRVVDDPESVAASLTENDQQALELIKARVRDRAPKAEQEDAEVAAFEELVAAHADELRELSD
ncbi:enoyl-CoA hydratase/isomerase family protein [Natronomonas halophila]|uniref:enoyl-CoA hydratase/isomerase family protein n=1 Tax=Natronomonas halophila TaxID=2747817 RepID=UPI0015B48295|nr:enoyl-CoA hydratase/isomerase family protein [Natronomonas halophila]QLD86739.1 enoyl-CoA hydratase/isomerase family protein [Natronomonas halophila]